MTLLLSRPAAASIAAGLALAGAAVAQPAPLPGIQVYTIDPYHTQPQFEWRHFDISTVRGRFDKTTGTLTLDRAHKKAKVEVTIDANSISTAVPLLDSRLKSSAFFDTAKFPTITFKSDDFKFDGDNLVSVSGPLTIHGITKPVTLIVHSAVCKDRRNPTMPLPACGADLELTLKRSDYGVGYFVPLVSDEILIRIGVEAINGVEGIEGQFHGLKPVGPAPAPTK